MFVCIGSFTVTNSKKINTNFQQKKKERKKIQKVVLPICHLHDFLLFLSWKEKKWREFSGLYNPYFLLSQKQSDNNFVYSATSYKSIKNI